MIVGEAEVQGQVKRAYEAALAAGTTGPLTNRLFGAALQTGKRVRTETGDRRAAASASRRRRRPRRATSSATSRSRTVVIIGAGETSELTAQALADQGVRTIFVANRHADRARSLAERFGGERRLARRAARPPRAGRHRRRLDRLAAPDRRGRRARRRSCAARGGRPLLLIDIAVPRDIEPACAASSRA